MIISPMQKILIIGIPGAGKSTLSFILAEMLDLPLIHLDKHFWNRGWAKTDEDIWQEKVKKLVLGERWIIDGNYNSTLHIRIPPCDTILFFDYPAYLSFWRVLKRSIFQRHRPRPDMADGCGEHFDFEFYKWIWNFNRRHRPHIFEMLEKHAAGKKLIVFKRPSGVTRFLDQLRHDLKNRS